MKKILAILLAGMMTATALVGCGGGDSSSKADGSKSGNGSSNTAKIEGSIVDKAYFGDEGTDAKPITLKVWAPDAAVSLVKKQVESFKKAYPDIKFKKIDVVAQGESDAATQILNDASAAADVFSFPSDQLNKLIDAGVLAPVAKGFVDTVTSENSEDTIKSATALNKKTKEDTLYAYPETNDNGYFLVYDKSVVSADQAQTFEGVLEACKKAGKKFIFDAGDGFYACTFAFTGGVKIDGLESDGVTQKFVKYDEDEAVATLQAFAKLIKKYKGTFTSLNVKNVASGFKNGTAGAGVDGSWDTKVNQEALGDNFGAAKLPTIKVGDEDKQLVSMFGYKYIGVNGSSQFPNAAQIFALYLTGEDCQQQRTEELGWGPSNLNVQKSDLVTKSEVLNAISEQAKNACVQVNIASTFWTPMGNLGNKLVADDCKPDDAAAMKKLLQDTIANVRDEG